MRQLEKITISNVRRFSENVEITVGRGATVFLAPNGTGKTAIFEAIELALTGRVKRLPFPPDALIRDSKNESKIRLDFDSGKFCETLFQKGVEPVLKGDHIDIFAGIPINDVAFLLRLTHLLNQRGSDWLVQSQSDAAADQLDHLAIGKDALRVNELIPSAKRQANSVLDAANRQLEEVKRSMELWQNLLNKRSQSNAQTEGSVVPLAELRTKLNTIGQSQNINAINTDSIDIIIGHQAVIQTILEKQKESNQQKLQSANVGDQLIIEYNETQGLLQQANEDLAKTKVSKREIAKEINTLQEQFIHKTNLLQSHEQDLVRLTTLRNQTLLLNDTKKEIVSSEDQHKAGKDYVVAQIASEAQITDLQFTFLLSMAQKYQWSPWRALLLDDPTQHHDLVHASAVFDLLRDYIMDQHFQILLATHDSTHANFFVRKLENDGIPTKLWKLQVTTDGVNAVLA